MGIAIKCKKKQHVLTSKDDCSVSACLMSSLLYLPKHKRANKAYIKLVEVTLTRGKIKVSTLQKSVMGKQ